MRKTSSKFDDKKKPSMAAASNFSSSASMEAPPLFSGSQATSASSVVSTQAQESDSLVEVENTTADAQLEEQEGPATSTIQPAHMMNAVKAGHELFKSTSRFTNVNIHGPIAIGGQGCFSAADVKSIIFAHMAGAMNTDHDVDMARAVSKVIAAHLKVWASGVMVPGLPWFPSFAFFPGPMAPPAPNTPSMLKSCPSFADYLLTNEHKISSEIMAELPTEMDHEANRNSVSIFSDMASEYFDMWLNTDVIFNVLGSGRVPSYAPPFIPGGPVMGKVIPIPGVLN